MNTVRDTGGGARQNKGEEREKGSLAVALGGMMAHLTTDAHELSRLASPVLCRFPSAVLLSHYSGGRKTAGGEAFFFSSSSS